MGVSSIDSSKATRQEVGEPSRVSGRVARRFSTRPLTRFGSPILLPFALCLLAGCDTSASAKVSKKPKVVVTRSITDTVMDYQDFTGRLDAVKTVEVRARVTGYVVKVPFKEGDIVKEGDLLFQIDDRPYQADLNQAEANLKLAIADQNLMEKNAERARKLIVNKSISREELETQVSAFEKSVASVGAMRAMREKAKLYLDYTQVLWERDKQAGVVNETRTPLTGRVSRRFVDPGNLVLADNTILTTIVTENPMYAYFDVDERTYLDLLAIHAAGAGPSPIPKGREGWSEGLKLPVLMRLANEDSFGKDKVGYVDFVDNRVVATTGTVRMRGVFQNPSGLLKAGLFMRIRLPIGSAYEATLIPDEAIQSDQERKYVWIVNDKNEVEYRSVKLGQAIKDLRVIRPPEKGKEGKEGLAKGDRIIVSGMQRVRNGTVVDPEEQTPPSPPEMPLVQLLRSREDKSREDKETRRQGDKETKNGSQ